MDTDIVEVAFLSFIAIGLVNRLESVTASEGLLLGLNSLAVILAVAGIAGILMNKQAGYGSMGAFIVLLDVAGIARTGSYRLQALAFTLVLLSINIYLWASRPGIDFGGIELSTETLWKRR